MAGRTSSLRSIIGSSNESDSLTLYLPPRLPVDAELVSDTPPSEVPIEEYCIRGHPYRGLYASMRSPLRQTSTVLPSWAITPIGKSSLKPSADTISTTITSSENARFW